MAVRWLGAVSRDRNNNLNLIRLIAATSVIVSHAWFITSGSPDSQPLRTLFGYDLGTLAVYVFFCISGFLVARSFERQPSLRHWVLARVLRLFPGLAVVLLLSMFVLGPATSTLPLPSYFADGATYGYLGNLSLMIRQAELPGVFAGQPISEVNGSLWSLRYEVICYGTLMVMGLAGSLRRVLPFAVAVAIYAAACLLVVLLPPHVVPNVLRTILSLGFIFGLGVGFYLAREWLPLSLVLLGVLAMGTFLVSATPLYRPVLLVTLCYGTFVLAYFPSCLLRRYNRFPDISYGVYIYGWPAQQIVVYSIGVTTPLVNAAYALPITCVLAWLSWTLVERPALSLVPHSDATPKAEPPLVPPDAALEDRAPNSRRHEGPIASAAARG